MCKVSEKYSVSTSITASQKTKGVSLRGKRFLKVFRVFKAFVAFWTRGSSEKRLQGSESPMLGRLQLLQGDKSLTV